MTNLAIYIITCSIGNVIAQFIMLYFLPDYGIHRVALNSVLFLTIFTFFCSTLYLFGWRPYGEQVAEREESRQDGNGEK